MKKKFQLVLSASIIVILQIGFWSFAKLAEKYIYNEVVTQIVEDNKVIGGEILKLINRFELNNKNDEELIDVLISVCNEIELPNKGFVCATRLNGGLVAGPGIKKGSKESLAEAKVTFLDNEESFELKNLEQGKAFTGFVYMPMMKRTDIVVSLPIPESKYRILVHQNNDAILERVKQYIHPLIYIGLAVTLILGFLSYLVVDKIVLNYEHKIEKKNAELEEALQLIRQQNEEITAQKEEVLQQRDTIMNQKEEITKSIQYAKRIQKAVFPQATFLDNVLKSYFIFFKPRDIVSGDFYFFAEKNDCVIVAAADCTGHGVPGAFMSMLGNAYLHEIISEKGNIKPDEILNQLREKIIFALKQKGEFGEAKDGMDISLCTINKKKNIIRFAGANNPLYIVRNNEIEIIKGDRMPIGIHRIKDKDFTGHEIAFYTNDIFYLFSDGYADQFGGERKEKFKYSRFRDLLLNIHNKPFEEQKSILAKNLDSWQGDTEQLDDILVIGFNV